jgi:hypothetical protein
MAGIGGKPQIAERFGDTSRPAVDPALLSDVAEGFRVGEAFSKRSGTAAPATLSPDGGWCAARWARRR